MRTLAAFFLLLASAYSQEPESGAFVPPQAYPMDRYEASWAKNPFTLKTAPAVIDNVSFAKDLAIGAHYGDKENPTIVIVNTKTHERTRLKKGETAANGMKINSFKLGDTRKQTTVEVTLGTESSELSYSSEYLSQVASAEGGKTAQTPQQLLQQQQLQQQGRPVPAGMAPGAQPRVTPGVPPRVQLPAGSPAGAQPGTASLPNGQRNMVSAGGGGVVNTGGGPNVNLTVPPSLSQPSAVPPLVAGPGAVPPRRRLIPSSNEQTIPQ